MQKALAIVHIYPELVPNEDFVILLENGVEIISDWKSSLPIPTEAQIKEGWESFEAKRLELEVRKARESQIISALGASDKMDAIVKQLNLINEAIASGDNTKIKEVDSAIKSILGQ